MLEAFPDPVAHGKQALSRIKQQATAKRSPDLIGSAADAVTHGGFQVFKEGARLLVDFGLVPGAKLTGKAVRSAVSGAIRTTGTLLGSLPVIPGLNDDSSLASANDLRFGRASIFPRPSLHQLSGTRDPRGGAGQDARNPDAESRSA